MNSQPHITFEGVEKTPSLRNFVTKCVEKALYGSGHRVLWSRVVLSAPHRSRGKVREYEVRIELGVPGKILVAHGDKHRDLYASVQSAFDLADTLLLRELGRRQSKRHRSRRLQSLAA